MVSDLLFALLGHLVGPLVDKRYPVLRKVAWLACGVVLSGVACYWLLVFLAP